MTLKMVVSDATKLRHVVESWSMLDEANLIASKNGLELRAMDPSRVAMVDFSLPVTSFETYECKKEPYRLGLNLEEFTAIMKRVSDSDLLTFELNNPSKLEITLNGKLLKIYGLALLDLGDSEYPAPKLTPNASITILTKTFHQLLKDAEFVSDQLILEANESSFRIRSDSEAKQFDSIIEQDNNAVASFKVKGNHRGVYSLPHLLSMTRPRISDLLQISFSSGIAVEFSYPVLAGGRLRYYCAPRIEI